MRVVGSRIEPTLIIPFGVLTTVTEHTGLIDRAGGNRLTRRSTLQTIGRLGLGSIVALGGVPSAATALESDHTAIERPPSVAWERTPGGVGAYVNAMTVASDGGYVFGAEDRLTKVDADGDTEWERTYDVGLVEAVTQTVEGYALAAQSGTGSSAVLAVDADGAPRWRSVIDEPEDDETSIPGGIVSDGTVIAVAGSVGNAEIGYERGYVVELDLDGDLRWYTPVEHERRSVNLYDIALVDEGYAAAGQVHRGDGQSPLFVHVDDGDIERERQYEDRSGIAFAIVRVHDRGYVLGGATLDEADDAFLLRADGRGAECQYCRYGEPGVGERIVDLAAVDGGYAFAGSRLEGAEGDAWVGRVDAELALSWAETYGDGRNGGVRTLVADEGGLAFGGSTTVDRAGRGWIVRLAAEN